MGLKVWSSHDVGSFFISSVKCVLADDVNHTTLWFLVVQFTERQHWPLKKMLMKHDLVSPAHELSKQPDFICVIMIVPYWRQGYFSL